MSRNSEKCPKIAKNGQKSPNLTKKVPFWDGGYGPNPNPNPKK